MPRHPLLQYLHATAVAADVTDAELARRFAQARDEAAFELLVRRHAETVWATCRKVLPCDHQAAEDAFQATFLALARKAGSLRNPCIAGWLYRVAVHAALKLRSKVAAVPVVDVGAPPTDLDQAETVAVVHEELAGLAEKFRLPIVLCDLVGLTRAQAAELLGWPAGTVAGRLVLARDRLRARLARRGLVAPAAALSAALAMSEPLSAGLIRVAVRSVAGGSASAAVVSLTEGVLSAMIWAKLKLAAIVCGAVVAGAGLTTVVAIGQDRPGADPRQPDPVPAVAAGSNGSPTAADDAEERAVRFVEGLGGAVRRDDKKPTKPVVGVCLDETKVTDADLKELAALKHLRKLSLRGTSVTDQGLKHLASLNNLAVLDLDLTPPTGAGLRHLVDLKDLTVLSLQNVPVTDEGLKHIATLKNLTYLYLNGTKVTDEGLQHLAALKNLNELYVGYTEVTDEGLKHLAGLKNLTELELDGTQVTDEGLKHLDGLKNLTTLSLGGTQVTDEGLQHLAALKNLNNLGLWGIQVTSDGLKQLAALRNLRALTGVGLTGENIKALHAAGLLHVLDQARAADDKRPASAQDVVAFRSGTEEGFTDEGLKYLAAFKNLTRLELVVTTLTAEGYKHLITDEGLKHLAGLKNLTYLRLQTVNLSVNRDGTAVTDEGLKHLAGLKNLTQLDLGGAQVTGEGLKHLADLKNLTALDLRYTKVTDDGLKHLADLKKLTQLYLDGTAVTGEGLKHLAGFKNLTELYLDGTKVTDDGLKHLAENKNVTELHLSHTGVADEGLKHLDGLKNLVRLSLTGTKVTDEGLKHLAGFNNLAELYLDGTQVTSDGLKQLAAFKNLRVLNLKDLTDKHVKVLHEAGLLHLLRQASAIRNGRPTKPEEVISLDLSGAELMSDGLKYIATFKNLTQLNLKDAVVNEALLEELQKKLPNCNVVR